MTKERVHLVALPHTQVSPAFYHCAFTQKLVNFCLMMKDIYDIQLYAPEGPEVEGATLHPCLTNTRRLEIFGSDDQSRLYAWPDDKQSCEFNMAAVKELQKNWQPGELILLSGGYTHAPINTAFPHATRAEPFIGYFGILPNTFRAFESYAHMHQCYMRSRIDDIQYFDTVVSPYINPAQFPLQNNRQGKYLLYIGRLIQRKGIRTAGEIAKAVDMPLWIAGAGGRVGEGGAVIAEDGTYLDGNVRYLGAVPPPERNELMANAYAVLVPTTFAEPGGNVSLEANFSGTPVITTDFGVFIETVAPSINGFRFRTLQEAVDAVGKCKFLWPKTIRRYVEGQYSLEATAIKFVNWFNKLHTLKEKGWYQLDS